MAETELLVAEPRKETGTAASRRLRRDGLIPAVLYGHESESVALTLRADEVGNVLRRGARLVDVEHDGKSEKALLREVQWDTFGREVLHIDLTRITAGERITVEVQIELRGAAPGVKVGGRLDHLLHAVEVECLATAIPELIRVSVNDLQLNQSITVSDLELSPEVVVQAKPESVVVQVSEVQEEADSEEGAEHAPVEPELIRKEKGEDEAEG